MKESEAWLKIAENVESHGGVFKYYSGQVCGLCGAVHSLIGYGMRPRLQQRMLSRLERFRPSGNDSYWWGWPQLGGHQGRTLAAWFLYHQALDDEKQARAGKL